MLQLEAPAFSWPEVCKVRASGPINWRRRLYFSLVLAAMGFLLYLAIRQNWHSAIPGKVYRSGQLDAGALRARIAKNQIQTIFNLRGSNPDHSWYQQERAVAAEFGVAHHDLQVGSKFSPTAEEIRTLILTLESCKVPLLIHCESGIDRSGPVAAMSILLLEPEGTLEQAREQLTIWYGHLPVLAATRRQRSFFDLYEGWLQATNRTHAPAHFREWALSVYTKPADWN